MVSKPSRIDGYAIISEDGMIANAAGVIPSALKFEADQQFFERGLDAVDVVIHGRNSKEQQARSAFRRRLILTRRIPSIAMKSGTQNALFWNPTGAPLEQAMKVLGVPNGSIGVIGGAEEFALFLDRYDTFYLTRAPGVQIPGGQPVFPEVPRITPEDVLSEHGLSRGERQVLDAKSGLVVVAWSRT